MNPVLYCEGIQRGLKSPSKLKGDILIGLISSFKVDIKMMDARKDFVIYSDRIASMDLAQSRLLAAYNENRVSIHNMDPPPAHLNAEDGYKDMAIKWRRPIGREVPLGGNKYVCAKFRKHDCGLFTISGESGSLAVVDCETLDMVCDMSACHSYGIYEHTYSPTHELLIGAVRSRHNLCIMDLRVGGVSLLMRYSSGSMKAISWSPRDENKIATAGTCGHVLLWDTRHSKNYMKKVHFPLTERICIPELKFDFYGKHLLYLSRDGFMRSIDSDELTEQYAFKCPNLVKTDLRYQFDYETISNPEIIFIPNGTEISVYSMRNGEKITDLEGHTFEVEKVVYNLRNKELYSSGKTDLSVLIWRSVPFNN